MGCSGEQIVEFAILRAADERVDLGACVDERGAVRMPGVAESYRAVGQAGQLDLATLSVVSRQLRGLSR